MTIVFIGWLDLIIFDKRMYTLMLSVVRLRFACKYHAKITQAVKNENKNTNLKVSPVYCLNPVEKISETSLAANQPCPIPHCLRAKTNLSFLAVKTNILRIIGASCEVRNCIHGGDVDGNDKTKTVNGKNRCLNPKTFWLTRTKDGGEKS